MYFFSLIVIFVFQVKTIINLVETSKSYFITFSHALLLAGIFMPDIYEIAVIIGAAAVIIDLVTVFFRTE